MPDVTVHVNTVTFSKLYGKLSGGKEADVKGWTKLWASSNDGYNYDFTTHSAARWSSHYGLLNAANVVRDAIRNEYGQAVEQRVFRNVFGNDGKTSKITLDQLKGLKHALQFEKAERGARGNNAARRATTFSEIEQKVQGQSGLSDDKHLRFRGTKGLYFHESTVKSLLPIHRLWAKSPGTKRKAAGAKIWQALANEHDKATANRIFGNVFGVRGSGDKPPEVAVTRKQLREIRQQINTEKELDSELRSALASTVGASKALDLVRRAVLGRNFTDYDPATVQSDLNELRAQDDFKHLSLPEIALELNRIDPDSDTALTKVPDGHEKKKKARLGALKAWVAREISSNSKEYKQWQGRAKAIGSKLTDPNIDPAEFQRDANILIDVASSKLHLSARVQAYLNLKAAIDKVRTYNAQIPEPINAQVTESIQKIRGQMRDLYPDIYQDLARRAAKQGSFDPNANSQASRNVRPAWSVIQAQPEDIDGKGHDYRALLGSDKFQPPPPISEFASKLQPDNGPVKDALGELKAHLKAHSKPNDNEVIYDPSDKKKVKPLTWDSFEYVWKNKFATIWQDPGFREFGTAYQMRRSMEDVLQQKTASERAHALASFVMNAATCEYGVEQGILNKYTHDIMGRTNLTQDEIQGLGDAETYRQEIEQVLQKRRMELFTGDQVSTHILGDELMQKLDPVHQRTFLLNAIGNHVGVQPDKRFENDKYARITDPNLSQMPQFEMLNHFYAVYTPKEMVKATRDHINGLLAHPNDATRNKHFQRLQATFFANERAKMAEYLSYDLDKDNKVSYELTDLGAARILEQMGHLERVAPAPNPSAPVAGAVEEPHDA